jgi:protein required for attachment to host cells
MTKQWVVVANGSRAAFYQFQMEDERAWLDLEAQFDHAQSRAKGVDLVCDRPGAVRGHGSDSAHYVPHTDSRRNEVEHFGQQLADELDRLRRAGRFSQLTLVASNPFLGVLRARLPEGTRDAVDRVIPHDYTQLDSRELKLKLAAAFSAVL